MSTLSKDRLLETPDEMNSTETLVEQAQQGCMESFRILVSNHHETVRLFIARHISCSTQVDDLAQEVFLAAFNGLARFRNDAKFSTWLLSIARNKAMQFLRDSTRRRQHQANWTELEILRQSIVQVEASHNAFEDHEARVDALQGCLGDLPLHARVLIEQFYYDNRTSDQIASEQDQNGSAVRMKLLRIRNRLRLCIRQKIAEHE